MQMRHWLIVWPATLILWFPVTGFCGGDTTTTTTTNNTTVVEEVDDDDDAVIVPPASSTADACDSSGVGAAVKAGGFSVAFPTYPCEVMRTYDALEKTKGRGFMMGTLPSFFLKVRILSKGVFSAIFGVLGLG
jgi:hypothetical protein